MWNFNDKNGKKRGIEHGDLYTYLKVSEFIQKKTKRDLRGWNFNKKVQNAGVINVIHTNNLSKKMQQHFFMNQTNSESNRQE